MHKISRIRDSGRRINVFHREYNELNLSLMSLHTVRAGRRKS